MIIVNYNEALLASFGSRLPSPECSRLRYVFPNRTCGDGG